MSSENRRIHCDGCGATASPEHLRQRLERLELATRYRPIHLECLVLYPAPPIRVNDSFYRPQARGEERSTEARSFFESIMAAAEVGHGQQKDETAQLIEFQRKGWYVAACCECPLEESGIAPQDVAKQFAESLLRRVRLSYKPKRIALASNLLEPLQEAFASAGFRDFFTLTNCQCD